MDCLFCKIVKGDVPSYKVYEDDKVLAFLDINPTSAGDTLIIPKMHYTDINDLNDELLVHIFEIGKKLAKEYEDKLDCDGYSFIQNNKSAQEIKHFHVHLTPYYKKNKDIVNIYEQLKKSN